MLLGIIQNYDRSYAEAETLLKEALGLGPRRRRRAEDPVRAGPDLRVLGPSAKRPGRPCWSIVRDHAGSAMAQKARETLVALDRKSAPCTVFDSTAARPASGNSADQRRRRAGRSSCGRWPQPSKTTLREPGIAATKRSAWATGIQRSSRPQSTRVGARDVAGQRREARRASGARGQQRPQRGAGPGARQGRQVLVDALVGDERRVEERPGAGRGAPARRGRAGAPGAAPPTLEPASRTRTGPVGASQVEARGVDQHQALDPLRATGPPARRPRRRPGCCPTSAGALRCRAGP